MPSVDLIDLIYAEIWFAVTRNRNGSNNCSRRISDALEKLVIHYLFDISSHRKNRFISICHSIEKPISIAHQHNRREFSWFHGILRVFVLTKWTSALPTFQKEWNNGEWRSMTIAWKCDSTQIDWNRKCCESHSTPIQKWFDKWQKKPITNLYKSGIYKKNTATWTNLLAIFVFTHFIGISSIVNESHRSKYENGFQVNCKIFANRQQQHSKRSTHPPKSIHDGKQYRSNTGDVVAIAASTVHKSLHRWEYTKEPCTKTATAHPGHIPNVRQHLQQRGNDPFAGEPRHTSSNTTALWSSQRIEKAESFVVRQFSGFNRFAYQISWQPEAYGENRRLEFIVRAHTPFTEWISATSGTRDTPCADGGAEAYTHRDRNALPEAFRKGTEFGAGRIRSTARHHRCRQ